MARPNNDSGMFTLNEFRNRGVIKMAPDVLVYINGTLGERVIIPVAGGDQTLDFADGITTVSIQNNIDPPGSSTASIEVTTPVYGEHSRYWVPFEDPVTRKVSRTPYFVPMMEVKIYLKGRFLVGDQPKYYPSFWGLISAVEENYSGGVWKINVNCVDMMHWLEYSTINLHPIPENQVIAGGGLKITPYRTIFEDANPFTIMATLTDNMGMHQFVVPAWAGSTTPPHQIFPASVFKNFAREMTEYWRRRFGNLGSLLKMYGFEGKEIIVSGPDGKALRTVDPDYTNTDEKPDSDKRAAAKPNNNRAYYANNEYLKGFAVFFDFDRMGDFSDAEYMTKLQVATEVKNRVDYEFFQDVTGAWIFKPPFLNLNTKTLLPYNIKPYDIISESHALDSEGIITYLEVQLPIHTAVKENIPRKGAHYDVELAGRYGVRHRKQNVEYIIKDNKGIGNQVAASYMTFINAKAQTGSLTIPGRPEIRLGYPIYLDHRDSFHYVKSVSHSFDYGGSFTTTLSLETERRKVYELSGEQWVGPIKDRIYLYRGSADIGESPIEESPNEENERKAKQSTGKISSIQQGRYEIAKREKPGQIAITQNSIPFTDEEGYRVIGAFQYGRGLVVDGATTMSDSDVQATMSDTPEEDRTALAITQMSTGSLREGSEMANAARKRGDTGTLIPTPLDTYRINDGKDNSDTPTPPEENQTLEATTVGLMKDPAKYSKSPSGKVMADVLRGDLLPEEEGSGVTLLDAEIAELEEELEGAEGIL